MLLMNICTIHGVNNKFVDELLSLLHKYPLLPNNCLPSNMYHAKTLTMKVGLNFHIIQACPKGCILFQGVHTNLDTCPKCGLTRYNDIGKAKVPTKVLHYFLLIPCLKPMFKVPITSNLMVWHNDNRSVNGLVRHVANSKAWAHIDVMWPEFATKPYNARLGLTTNGVNPFGAQSSTWSTRPVMLQIYNLPPWLVTIYFFGSYLPLLSLARSMWKCITSMFTWHL